MDTIIDETCVLPKYELVDGIKLVDPFDPEKIKGVIFDKKVAKAVKDFLNQPPVPEEPKVDKRKKDPEIKDLRYQLNLLKQKCERYKAILDANGWTPHPGRKRTGEKTVTKPAEYKQRMCPGFGGQVPHLFTPKGGRQEMCPSCRQAFLEAKRHVPSITPTTRTTWRGSGGGIPGANVEKIPTIEEVLMMPPGEDRAKWEARWSPAEAQQAAKLKWKVEREKMRKMQHKGFDINDPIMGANAKQL